MQRGCSRDSVQTELMRVYQTADENRPQSRIPGDAAKQNVSQPKQKTKLKKLPFEML